VWTSAIRTVWSATWSDANDRVAHAPEVIDKAWLSQDEDGTVMPPSQYARRFVASSGRSVDAQLPQYMAYPLDFETLKQQFETSVVSFLIRNELSPALLGLQFGRERESGEAKSLGMGTTEAATRRDLLQTQPRVDQALTVAARLIGLRDVEVMSEEMTSEVQGEESGQASGSAPENNAEAPGTQDKPADDVVPKAALLAERKKRQEYEKAATELEQLKKAQADEAAAKANDIEKFKTERDQYEAEASQWRQYATDKLEGLADQLDDAGKAILEDLGDDVPLHKRVSIAEKLVGNKKSAAGFGSNGGGGAGETTGPIPSSVKTKADFHSWIAKFQATAEGRAKLADPEFNRAVTAERLKRFG